MPKTDETNTGGGDASDCTSEKLRELKHSDQDDVTPSAEVEDLAERNGADDHLMLFLKNVNEGIGAQFVDKVSTDGPKNLSDLEALSLPLSPDFCSEVVPFLNSTSGTQGDEKQTNSGKAQGTEDVKTPEKCLPLTLDQQLSSDDSADVVAYYSTASDTKEVIFHQINEAVEPSKVLDAPPPDLPVCDGGGSGMVTSMTKWPDGHPTNMPGLVNRSNPFMGFFHDQPVITSPLGDLSPPPLASEMTESELIQKLSEAVYEISPGFFDEGFNDIPENHYADQVPKIAGRKRPRPDENDSCIPSVVVDFNPQSENTNGQEETVAILTSDGPGKCEVVLRYRDKSVVIHVSPETTGKDLRSFIKSNKELGVIHEFTMMSQSNRYVGDEDTVTKDMMINIIELPSAAKKRKLAMKKKRC